MLIYGGNGGWVELEGDPRDNLNIPGRLYARFSKVDGRPRVTELYMDGEGKPIPAASLRRFPLALIEQLAADAAMQRVDIHSAADLSRLATYFATAWSTYDGEHCEACTAPLHRGRHQALTDWPALAWFAQYEGLEGYGIKQVKKDPKPRRRDRRSVEPIVLTAPEHGLTDAFLSDVARAYDQAVEQRLPPAKTLAEVTGVNVKTVNSWCYKARKRGLMRPATKKGRIV